MAKAPTIESLAIRRAELTDADKVRYRVYRSADDFIAVIAESALMAVKVSGIDAPYRIVRDLPSEGIAIMADRMAKQEGTPLRVSLPTEKVHKKIELPKRDDGATVHKDFTPMHIRDLQKPKTRRIRILSPEELETMAVQSSKKVEAAPPPPPEPELRPIVEAVPIVEEAPAAPSDPDKLTPEQVEALLKQ